VKDFKANKKTNTEKGIRMNGGYRALQTVLEGY
jgi:hypothetical protein